MKFNFLFSTSLLLGLAKLSQCVSSGSGEMTFYGEHGGRPSSEDVPACGRNSHYNTNYYAAMNKSQFDSSKTGSDSSSASVCDKCVKIYHDGKYAVGRIVDRCGGDSCVHGNIDVSPTMFEKLAPKKEGRVKITWEILSSCSELGSYGSGSGSSHHDDDDDDKKTTTRKTTTTKSTTTQATKTEDLSKVDVPKPTNPVEINSGKVGNITISTNENINGTITNPINPLPNTPQAPKVAPKKIDEANSKVEKEEEEEESSSGVPFIITGAVAVTGAAGIGLLYAKRNSSSYEEIKQKFPEAFTNLKRSITRGSSNIRRGLTRSGTALKRSLTGGRKARNLPHSGNLNRESLQANYPPAAYLNPNQPEEPQPTIRVYDY